MFDWLFGGRRRKIRAAVYQYVIASFSANPSLQQKRDVIRSTRAIGVQWAELVRGFQIIEESIFLASTTRHQDTAISRSALARSQWEEVKPLCYKLLSRDQADHLSSIISSGFERIKNSWHQGVHISAPATDIIEQAWRSFRDKGLEEKDEILSLLDMAAERGVADDAPRARMIRLRGELCEAEGDAGAAIDWYQQAIAVNPSVGIKQRLEKLLKAHEPKRG